MKELKILKYLTEIVNRNIKTLKFNDTKSITLNEATEKFIDYKINVEKVKQLSIL